MSSIQTIQGRLADDPETGVSDTGTSWTRLIVLASDRYQNHRTGEWVDGPVTRYRVSSFHRTAENAANSLHKGDPVVVTGTVITSQYTDKTGDVRTSRDMRAAWVGADLARCTVTIHRRSSQDTTDQDAGGDESVPAA